MSSFLHLLKLDILLQVRYQIYTIYALVGGLYILLLSHAPEAYRSLLSIIVIFSDPSLLGMLFIGALVLLERGEGTLDALIVTPAKPQAYLLAKAVSLTLLACLVSGAIALWVHGAGVNLFALLAGVALTSFLCVFGGFALVVRVDGLNGFLVVAIGGLSLINVPLLEYTGALPAAIAYIFPTKASLLLLEGAFGELSRLDLLYSLTYLGVFCALAYRWALACFQTYVIESKGGRL